MKAFTATAPSNIAFVKYWGKADADSQWPANDSLSMTLRHAVSRTSAQIIDAEDHLVTFEGLAIGRDQRIGNRIFRHLDRLAQHGGFTEKLRIQTQNTFPAGCGIASSASGFAALTLSSLAAWTHTESLGELINESFSPELLANFARMGSGSACRSLFGGYVVWRKGKRPERQLVRSVYDAAHWRLCDLIIIAAPGEKAVTSTEGHSAAWTSPLFGTRLAGIPERIKSIKRALKQRDISLLGRAMEDEALDMHAVMMTSQPALHYLHENTFAILQWVRQYRHKNDVPVFFTLDAGPTVHLICESEVAEQVHSDLKSRFPEFAVLRDEVGPGPQLVASETENNLAQESSNDHAQFSR